MPTQISKIDEPIDRAQHMIGRHELIEAKFVQKALLHHEPIAPHRLGSPCRHSSRESPRRAASEHFFNKICQERT
jgi:hypothetical protein